MRSHLYITMEGTFGNTIYHQGIRRTGLYKFNHQISLPPHIPCRTAIIRIWVQKRIHLSDKLNLWIP